MRLKDMPVLERDDTALDRVVALQGMEVGTGRERSCGGEKVGRKYSSLGVKTRARHNIVKEKWKDRAKREEKRWVGE